MDAKLTIEKKDFQKRRTVKDKVFLGIVIALSVITNISNCTNYSKTY